MTTDERIDALEKSGRRLRLTAFALISLTILAVVVAALLNQNNIRIEAKFNTDANDAYWDTADDPNLLRSSIEAQNSRYAAAFNSQDPEKVTLLHTENALVMPPNHPAVKGREDIQKLIEADIQAGMRDLSLTTLSLVAADGVDLPIVAQHTIGMRQTPRTQRVGRKTRMDQTERSDHVGIV